MSTRYLLLSLIQTDLPTYLLHSNVQHASRQIQDLCWGGGCLVRAETNSRNLKNYLIRAETNSLQLLIFGISGEVTCKGSNWDQVGWAVQRNRTSLVSIVDVLKQKQSE